MPDHHERLFLDYLDYLRCQSQKHYTLIDVKYNTTHFLARPWQERGAPYLLELIVKYGLYVVNVTRRNYLRSVLSSEKAWHSNCYSVPDGDSAYVDGTRYLDPDYVLRELSHCLDEDRRIQQELTPGDRVLTYDYTEIFSGSGGLISPEFLERFADWRGIDNAFTSKPACRKQSSLPLRETIENYDEIAAALRDGPFAYCLEDEPAYRFAEAPLAPAMPRGRMVRVSYGDTARDVWRDVIGSDPDLFCTTFYRKRPSWIEGSLSEDDARFLFQQVLTAGADEAVEIGTGTGLSTAVLAHGMHFRAAAGQASHDWRVRSYDFLENLWFDPGRQVGDAARELLSEPLLAHVEFNSPALAVDVAKRHAADSIRFLFLDANHNHPWPALDLLAVLEVLGAGGIVVLHDVNLPRIHPEFPEWGVNRVFEELNVEKVLPDVELPNIGAFVVPSAKGPLRDQLIGIVERRPWDVDVREDFVERLVKGAGLRSG
jgi:predicted O-methyltransferase YrrM